MSCYCELRDDNQYDCQKFEYERRIDRLVLALASVNDILTNPFNLQSMADASGIAIRALKREADEQK